LYEVENMKYLIYVLYGTLLGWTGARAETVVIADGDVAAFVDAVNTPRNRSIRTGGSVEIVLASNGHYAFPAHGLAMQPKRHIRVDGRGAVLTVNGVRRRALLVVTDRAVNFSNISIQHVHSEAPALFEVSEMHAISSLNFVGTTFNDITLTALEGTGKVALVNIDSGFLFGSFVTLSHLVLTGDPEAQKAVLFSETGNLELSHLTVADIQGDANSVVISSAMSDSSANVEGSLSAGNGIDLCRGSVRSRGDNLFDEDSCKFRKRGDRVIGDLGLLPLNSTLGPRPVYPLSPSSPAIDSGSVCSQVYRFGFTRPLDGNGDGVVRCDAGAFEMASVPAIQGRANGLYFQRADDGHFVTIQRSQAAQYVVNWYTFDRAGKQAWILAVGERSGDVISADAFFSTGGQLRAGAGPSGQDVRPWGRVQVKLNSCDDAVFEYHSDLAEFASGSFALDRLALIDSIGCGGQP